MEREPYFESQVGGNCRIHAVNMALQSRALDENKLRSFGKMFGQVYGTPEGIQNDYTGSDGITLPAFCAERLSGRVFAFGLNWPSARTVYGCQDTRDLFSACKLREVCLAALVYNPGHVWAVTPSWHLDSLGRPRRIHQGMENHFGTHHVALLLDRDSCWAAVRRAVSLGLRFQLRKSREPGWAEFLSKRFESPKESDNVEKPKCFVMSMLGHCFQLLAVGLRADCRCSPDPEVRQKATKAVAELKARYLECTRSRQVFVSQFAPLLSLYATAKA